MFAILDFFVFEVFADAPEPAAVSPFLGAVAVAVGAADLVGAAAVFVSFPAVVVVVVAAAAAVAAAVVATVVAAVVAAVAVAVAVSFFAVAVVDAAAHPVGPGTAVRPVGAAAAFLPPPHFLHQNYNHFFYFYDCYNLFDDENIFLLAL